MQTKELVSSLNALLEPHKFKDYAPNGLQVEGAPEIKKIICGVSASEELIDIAIEQKAQAILVHHGYFWKSENPCVIGIKRNRLKKLLANDINLIAYHLPLDNHPEYGNNVLFGKALGVKTPQPLAEEPFLWMGDLPEAVSAEGLSNTLTQLLDRAPFVVPLESQPAEIKTIAWCTGAGQDFLELAARSGAQAYISGEISERTVLESRELGVPYFCAGHHATETFGITALATWLRSSYPDAEVEVCDLVNPV